jgi:hypothetical protein
MASLIRRNRSSEQFELPLSAPPPSSYAACSTFPSAQRCGTALVATLLIAGTYCSLGPFARAAAVTRDASMRDEALIEAQAVLDKVAVSPAKESPPCQDVASRCAEWAAAGECVRNTDFMHRRCAYSCGTCGMDIAEPEPKTKQQPQTQFPLKIEPQQQQQPAAQSPQQTQQTQPAPSRKEPSACPKWAAAGECEKNKAYMLDKCKETCAERQRGKEEA